MQLQELEKEIGKWFVDHYKKVKENLDKVGEHFEPLDHHDIYADLDLHFGEVLKFVDGWDKDNWKDYNFFIYVFREIVDRELDRLDLQAIADKVNKELAL